MKIPVLFLKISPLIRMASLSTEGGWEGLNTKARDPSRSKAALYVKKAVFLEALEICEGKGLSLRHESPLSCYTDGRST